MSVFRNQTLADALVMLCQEMAASRAQRHIELQWFKSRFNLATKHDLETMEDRIMSKISEFAAKQNAHNDRQDAAVTELTADVQALNAKIDELQNSPGTITPEDQAALDALEQRGDAIATKLEALAAATPPTPPTT